MTTPRSDRVAARDLGRRSADLVMDPSAFELRLARGLRRLAARRRGSAPHPAGPPGPPWLTVRPALLRAVAAPVVRSLADASPAVALYLADRLSRAAAAEVRFLAGPILGRSLAADPERSWQLIRRLGRTATDRATVDALADLAAAGIEAEPYRWAELEQLVYATSPWERHLVAATLAALARRRSIDLEPEPQAQRALTLAGQLMGDPEPAVQTGLAAALRLWTRVAPTVAAPFWHEETLIAASRADGHRARVLRLASPALAPVAQVDLRARLAGLRSRRVDPSTSRAHETAMAFVRAGFVTADASHPPEPPLRLAAGGGSGRPVGSLAR